MRSLVDGLKNIPKKAFGGLNRSVKTLKKQKLYGNSRSAKLLNALVKIQRKTMKDTSDICIGFIFASPETNAN